MTRILPIAAVIVSAAAVVALSEADGCGIAHRQGDYVRIAEESAIIVWDPVKKVEHFIRRAALNTKSPDFGFLVPTPTKPVLAEVEDTAFLVMDRWLLPKVVEKSKLRLDAMCCFVFPGAMRSGVMVGGFAKDSVRVLGEQKIGGFDTAILEADSTEDLAKWLKDHGYSNDPALQSWLVPYVTNKWKITAFKITQDPATGKLATTKPVRMSFAADRPFFPYREPERKEESVNGKVEQKKQIEPTEIDGIWTVESSQLKNGKGAADGLKGTKFWFNEGVVVGRYIKDGVPYTVDSSKEPKWLDLGKKNGHGIYKLEGDTLTWCDGSTARPSRFDATEGMLLVLRRGTRAEADAFAADIAARKKEERLQGGRRLLRVYFVSDARAEGKLGDAAWHAKVPRSDRLTDDQRKQLLVDTGVPEADVPANAWMTAFEDRASPRPGKEEVYFDPAQEQTPILPPPTIHYNEIWIPVDVVLGLVVLGLLVVAMVFRSRRRHPTELQQF